MSSHKHAPWRKSVLIPCWVVQLGLMLLTVASAVLALKLTNDRYYYDSSGDYVVEKNVINIVAAVLLAITVVCIALTIAEIIQLARRKLSPKVFVIMNTIKSTFQTVMFVISIASVASRDSVAVGLLSLLIQGVLLLAFLGPLIYGGVIYHRARKGRGTAYTGVAPASNAPIVTSYPSQYATPTYGVPQTYPSPYEAPRSVGGTTVSGDLESGVTPMTEYYAPSTVQQRGYIQDTRIPESEPLAGQTASGMHGDNVHEMASRRELR